MSAVDMFLSLACNKPDDFSYSVETVADHVVVYTIFHEGSSCGIRVRESVTGFMEVKGGNSYFYNVSEKQMSQARYLVKNAEAKKRKEETDNLNSLVEQRFIDHISKNSEG